MLIQIGKHIREVDLLKSTETTCFIQVGDAIVVWDIGKDRPSYVDIPKSKGWMSQYLLKEKVIPFISEWKRALNNDKVFPIPINDTPEHKKKAGVCSLVDPNRVSGVPLWMKEKCKVWVLCCGRQKHNWGEPLYYARRKFKKEGNKVISIVDKYKDFCYKCHHRGTCSAPCLAPATKSLEDLAIAIPQKALLPKVPYVKRGAFPPVIKREQKVASLRDFRQKVLKTQA